MKKEEKISRQIVVLSVLVILYSFQGLPGLNFSFYAMKFYPLPEKWILARYGGSIALRVFLFIAGIGILFRKDIFRKIIVGICLWTIFTVYWKHPLGSFKNSLMFNIRHGIIPVDLMPKIDMMAWTCLCLAYTIDITISLFFIYLFTRPKIKEQFTN